jgi:hypothetical protein
MPDWICAGPGLLAIGEAKGSNMGGPIPPKGKPPPIRTAEKQIKGVRVQKKVTGGARPLWQSKRVKGWAVMSRWGTANPPRDPYLYAQDPETDGELLTLKERAELIQAVARRHVELLAIGLGLLRAPSAGKKGIEVSGLSGRRLDAPSLDLPGAYLGRIFSPFGPLDLSLDQARALASQFPDNRMLQFVGIEEDLFQPIVPPRRSRPDPRPGAASGSCSAPTA